jgi:endonuclease/exonuclease/phosphatase family metal-dependent hydrolase
VPDSPADRPAGTMTLTVASANLCYGGLDQATGDDSQWRTTITALAGAAPDIVLAQEMDARGDPYRLWFHLRRTAAALGLEPVLGPSAALRSQTGNHTAILIRTSAGIGIEDQWPPPAPAAPGRPWCWAQLAVPGLDRPLHAYSVHLSARSATAQRQAAEELASYATGQLALVGGDFNSHPRAGPVPAPAQLQALETGQSRQILLTRCRRTPGGTWEPDYATDDVLTAAGLADVAARCPGPGGAAPTTADGARADRCYVSASLAPAAVSCRPLPIGSDHAAIICGLDLSRLTGPRP